MMRPAVSRVEPVHEEGPEAVVALHRVHEADAHAGAGLDCEARWLVEDEYLPVLVEAGDHRDEL